MDSLAAAYSSSVSRAFSSAYLLWRSSKQSAKPPQPHTAPIPPVPPGWQAGPRPPAFQQADGPDIVVEPFSWRPCADGVIGDAVLMPVRVGTSGWRTKGDTLALRWDWGGARVGSLPPWPCPSAVLFALFSGPAVFSAGPIRRRMAEICSTRSIGKPTAPSKVRSRREHGHPRRSFYKKPPASSVTSLPIRSRSAAAVSVSSRGGGGCSSFAAGRSGVGKSPITRSHFFSSRS